MFTLDISILDWLVGFVYVIFLYLIFTNWAKKRYNAEKLKVFRRALQLKILGSLFFICFHLYIFKGGDTLVYFDTSVQIKNYFFTDFSKYASLVTSKISDLHTSSLNPADIVVFSKSNFFLPRVGAFLAIFTFGNYIATTFLLCFLTLCCIWYAVQRLVIVLPENKQAIYISFLYIPSVFVWGSGFGKDNLTFGALCLFLGAALQIFILKKKFLKNIFFALIGIYLLLTIKSYIFYSFLIAFPLAIFAIRYNKLSIEKKRKIKPVIIILITIMSYLAYSYVIKIDENPFISSMVEDIIKGSISNGEVSGAKSSYDLGIDYFNFKGFKDFIAIVPSSIIVTLFRPFIWEIKSLSVVLSAIESLFFLLATLGLLFKCYFLGIFKIMFQNPLMIFCLVFALLFASFVGISSGNFGTLVRYKLPCIPFYSLFLLLGYAQIKKNKTTIAL